MTSGRRPKPTALKRLNGNPGKGPLNENEPTPPPDEFDAPEWMIKDARALSTWNHLYPMLKTMGILTIADAGVLESYCSAYADWVRAREHIIAHGPYTTTVNKAGAEYISAHPAVLVGDKAQALMAKWGAMLGLNPADRSKLQVNLTTPDEKDKWHGVFSQHG